MTKDSRADARGRLADQIAEAIGARRHWSPYVTINMVEYERQQAEKARDREFRRKLDPYGLGHWSPIDDDEADR